MQCMDMPHSAANDDGIGAEPSMVCQRGEDAYNLSVALNYGYSAGSLQLLRFMTDHVELLHDPPYDN